MTGADYEQHHIFVLHFYITHVNVEKREDKDLYRATIHGYQNRKQYRATATGKTVNSAIKSAFRKLVHEREIDTVLNPQTTIDYYLP